MKRRHRACGSPTKAEQAHQDAQRAHGCAFCLIISDRSMPAAIHHRNIGDLAGNKQLGQDATVGLCDWHHQGVPLPGKTVEGMRADFGPSLFHHKKAFLDVIADNLGERSTAALQAWQDNQLTEACP